MPVNYFVVGFLWGTGRISGESFLVQTRHSELLETIRAEIAPKQKLFASKTDSGILSNRLKLSLNHSVVQWMVAHYYQGRNGNIQRTLPELALIEDEAEFLRGYFSVHYSLDTFKNKGKIKPRLRFYASSSVLERLNQHLNKTLGTRIKTVQPHSRNDVCHILYYVSKSEIEEIIEYLKLGV